MHEGKTHLWGIYNTKELYLIYRKNSYKTTIKNKEQNKMVKILEHALLQKAKKHLLNIIGHKGKTNKSVMKSYLTPLALEGRGEDW